MDSTIPIRDNFWNIPIPLTIVFYVIMLFAVLGMFYTFWTRVRVWMAGLPDDRMDNLPARTGRFFSLVLGQAKLLRQSFGGLMHSGLFYGFLVLFMGTVLATIDADIVEFLRGNMYVSYEFVLDLFGLFFGIALLLGLARRLITRPRQLSLDRRFYWFLGILLTIDVSGLLVEAVRLAVLKPWWADASPVGWFLAQPFINSGLSEAALRNVHLSFWMFHVVAFTAFLISIPYTPLVHIITSPLNVFFSSTKPKGALQPIPNIEEAETLGVMNLADLTWKQLLDADACTECGRCTLVCPANMAGTPLNPKMIMVNIQRHVYEHRTDLLALVRDASNGEPPQIESDEELIGDVIDPEALWACTTCRACMQECPVMIEHVPTIMDMRRAMIMMIGNVPNTLGPALQRMERNSNPWGYNNRDRADWTQQLDFEVPLMADKQKVDVLWWVGCSGSFDPRNQKVSKAIAKILHEAGVDFAILGPEEMCSGDSARRAGNEYQFQMMAEGNIETLNQYQFSMILAQCPHCFNTLANEYPQFGGEYRVVHHTEFIASLIRQGRIKPTRALDAELTYHDSCYLGRYNDIFDAPRQILQAIPGLKLVEMVRSQDLGLCCGAGGAQMWMETHQDPRVNVIRARQIIELEPAGAATACPFCITMITDGIAAEGQADAVMVKDVAEYVAESLA